MAADRRAGTVRVRITVAAVVVVGVALVIGAMALVAALRGSLIDEVRRAAQVRAADVAAALESGRDPPVLAVAAEDEELVQVLDVSGRVVTSSANMSGRAALARLRPGASAQVKTPIDEDDFVAVAAVTGDGQRTVIVARALADVFESAQILTRLLVIGLPVLLVLVGITMWKAVGRALAPVEAIRAEVDEISASELHRRVPDLPGSDEISRLSATMNRMLDRLERARDRQRRFISDASHELRSPVAAIRQHAEVALAHPERTTVDRLAETVLAEDLRVQRLVEDLLLLARADEQTLRLGSRPVDLDDLVFDEARRLRDATDLRIDTTAVSAGLVHGDAMGLRRVLRNLGDNAAHHARSRVAFGLAERDGVVALTVEDDGPGIPEGERARVFERQVGRPDGARPWRNDQGRDGRRRAAHGRRPRGQDLRAGVRRVLHRQPGWRPRAGIPGNPHRRPAGPTAAPADHTVHRDRQDLRCRRQGRLARCHERCRGDQESLGRLPRRRRTGSARQADDQGHRAAPQCHRSPWVRGGA